MSEVAKALQTVKQNIYQTAKVILTMTKLGDKLNVFLYTFKHLIIGIDVKYFGRY